MHTLQQNRRVRKKNGLSCGRRIREKGKEKSGARIRNTNGFLKQRFGPVLDIELQDVQTANFVEDAFYNSLKNLAQLYRFEPLVNTSLPYPLNIRKSFMHAQSLVEKKGSQVQLIVYQDFQTSPVLATARELDTNLTLFYIPLEALWKLHLAKNKPAFDLLISVFAYLHQVIDMPLFTDDNYVGSTCEMIFEQLDENEYGFEDEELKGYRVLASTINRVAPIMNKEIQYHRNLEEFESRIDSFQPKSDFDEGLLTNARSFHQIKQRFPGRSFMEHLSCGFMYFDEDEITHADQYFSFCWTVDGWLMDNLDSYVNSDLQERSYLDQPCSVQLFSKRQREETHGFEFHFALMEQLNLLVDTLNMIQ
jgi:hypothetical protein